MKSTKYVSVKEAGRILNYSDTYIRMMIDESLIQAEKVGNQWIILKDSLQNIKPKEN